MTEPDATRAEADGDAAAVDSVATDVRARLAELERQPLAEHPAAYEAVHTELRRALATIDDA